MGYIEVEVSNCLLSFSRQVTATIKNNNFYKYTRIIHLENLDFDDMSPVHENRTGSVRLLEFDAPFTESYMKIYEDVLLFPLWAKTEGALGKWPYDHPMFHDENSAAIEAVIPQFFANIDRMNL